jgi:dTDP-glucose 4,6-dehydratase
MTLFVTGGAGFIGSNFIHYWLKNHPQDRVINFDALTYAGNQDNLKSLEKNPQYIFVKGNITNPESVRQAMQGCDVVVHYAAESHVDRSVTGPAIFVDTNVVGTQVLLDQAVKQGIQRFHHVSTDEVFGSLELGSSKKFNEETPYAPSSPYSATKAASDHLVRAYYHTYGLSITISNCSNNYGPYHFPEKLIPLMIINAIQDKLLPVYGDGLNVRDWIHVEDHARGVELILEKGRDGETYCLGGEAERSNLFIVKEILRLLNKPESLIEFVEDRPGHDRRYAIDIAKARAELGFSPAHTIESGLAQTVQWYLENVDWWKRIL